MKKLFDSEIWFTVHDDPANVGIGNLIPEVIAQESLMILENEMVMAHLVHRDYEDLVARMGQTVNAHRPAKFTANRKALRDSVVVQAAQVDTVPVTLNQHWETSFMIADGEESMTFPDLVQYFLKPAVQSIAQAIDEFLCSQLYRFIANGVGKLGTDATKSTVISAREALNALAVPLDGQRNLVVPPAIEGHLLNVADFVNANTRGDDGSALRTGHMGQLLGFETFMSQNMPTILPTSTTKAVALNGAHAAGATTLALTNASHTLVAGAFITVAGEMTPHRILTVAGGPPTTSVTISPALKSAALTGAVVTYYTPGAINKSSEGYAADYLKALVVNGFTVAPQPRQLIGLGANLYGALGTPTTISLVLDRPLVAAAAHASAVAVGPAGNYGLAFHRNAIGLVTRPLAAPARGTGALSFTASYNGLAIRVTITYQGREQGHLVVVDILGGVAQYDSNMAAPVYA